MKATMNSRPVPGFALAGLALALGGCQQGITKDQPKPQAAAMTMFADVSASTAFINTPSYADAAIKLVGQMTGGQKLGDAFRIVQFGSRTTDRAVDVLSVTSGYQRRLPNVRKQVETSLIDLLAANRQNGGDGTTNLLYTLENARPICTPRSRIVILSDGIEDSEGYSVSKALAAGKPVHLPPPSTPYLKGCAVAFIGIGVAPFGNGSQAETLPSAALQNLIAGFREYMQSAGVNPADMSFQSIL